MKGKSRQYTYSTTKNNTPSKANGDLEDDGEGNTYVDLRKSIIFNNS